MHRTTVILSISLLFCIPSTQGVMTELQTTFLKALLAQDNHEIKKIISSIDDNEKLKGLLQYSARAGNPYAVNFLLNKAKLNPEDLDIALYFAALGIDKEFKLDIPRQVRPSSRPTPHQGHEVVAHLLMSYGASLEQDEFSRTPLSYAAENNNTYAARAILEKIDMQNPKIKGFDNQTALDIAQQKQHQNITYLLEHFFTIKFHELVRGQHVEPKDYPAASVREIGYDPDIKKSFIINSKNGKKEEVPVKQNITTFLRNREIGKRNFR